MESAAEIFESLRSGGTVTLNLCDVPVDALEVLLKCGLAPRDRLAVKVALDASIAAELEHDAEDEEWKRIEEKRQKVRARVRRHREAKHGDQR